MGPAGGGAAGLQVAGRRELAWRYSRAIKPDERNRMTGSWIVMGIGMLALSTPARTQDLRSQDGFRVTSQRVHLAETVPVPCVAVAAPRAEATIVLSREELEGLAAVRTRVDDSEPARLAFIAGMRARALLGQ